VSTLLLDQRPVTDDPILLHAFARRRRPLSVSDLLRAMTGTGARLSDVMELLSRSLADGVLGPHGFRNGARLYELTDRGWDAVAADRLA
jgi:hypothetical protein